MIDVARWMVVVMLVVAFEPAGADQPSPIAALSPRRPDIVAHFSAGGFVQFDANGHVGMTSLRSGTISLSTDEPFCVAAPDHPCRYTINEIELVGEDTSVGGTDVTNIRTRSLRAAPGVIDDGTGMRLTVPPGMVFQVSGVVDGRATAFLVTAAAPNALSMAIDPVLQQITLFGNLEGSKDGWTLHLDILATTDAPFANVPPVANAGPDQVLRTGCYALATLDPSGTVDPNGDRVYQYYAETGHSLGDGSEPIALMPGTHRLILNAFDAWGARDTDEVVIRVEDDGSSAPTPDGTIFSIPTPPGVEVENVGVLATVGAVSFEPRSSLSGASVVSLGDGTSLASGTTIQGDLWSVGPVSLSPNATITGTLHSAAPVTSKPGASIGALDSSPTFDPPTLLSWNVVIPTLAAPAVAVGPNQTRTIAPGNYGAVSVGYGASLQLSTGTYFLSSLATQPSASLLVDDARGPVFVYVRNAVNHRGALAGSAKLLLVAGADVNVAGEWSGTIVALTGKMGFGPPPNPPSRGAIFGRTVQLQSPLTHHAFAWDVVRAGRAACAITPTTSCVKQTAPTSFIARFDYTNAVTYASIHVPVGPANRFFPGPEARRQPTTFLPGHPAYVGHGAFEVPFDGTPLTWVVGGRTATASSNSPRCP